MSPEIIFSRVERQIELFGGDLLQRREDALAELDLAGEDGRGAVGVDAQPRIEPAVGLQAAGQPLRASCASRSDGASENASTMPPIPLVNERRVRIGAFMVRSSRSISRAARITAPTIRLWVPQRQRLPASASFTSASVAFGLRSSSSFADMIMPLMQ